MDIQQSPLLASAPIFELTIVSSFRHVGQNGPKVPHHTTPCRQTATNVDESEGLRCRVRVAASICLVLAAQHRKLSRSGWLGWRREPSSATCGRATEMQLSTSLAYALFLVSKYSACRRNNFFVSATAGEILPGVADPP